MVAAKNSPFLRNKKVVNPKVMFVLWTFRILVGILFLISGFIKVNDITGFAYKLEEYFHVFERNLFPGFIHFTPFSIAIAAAIAIFEVFTAITLLLGYVPRFTTSSMLLMIIFFTLLTGYSFRTGLVSDCGCFGDVLKLTPLESFIKDLVLMGMIGFLFVHREKITNFWENIVNDILVPIVFAGTCFLTWYNWANLPMLDFLPYKVGADIKHNTTTLNEKGEFIAKDYTPIGLDCKMDEFEGNTFIIIMRDMASINSDEYVSLTNLAIRLSRKEIKVLGATASTRDVKSATIANYKIPFCVASMDQTVLKTMIRSNLGFMLLKNGICLGKWHGNNLPQDTEVLGLLH